MITLNASKKLNIVLQNTNRAFNEVVQSASPEELEGLRKGKDLKSIVEDLLKRSLQNPSQDKNLLSLVKENPTLKDLGTVNTSLKELLQSLKKEKTPLPLEKKLDSFMSNIKDMSDKNLQSKLENSGLFLENKLKNMQTTLLSKEVLSQDLKAILLKAQDEIQTSQTPNKQELLKQTDKLLLQIDYHQLLSHLSNATVVYIPYEWNMLEDGNISMKSSKDGKFFTDIELQLKEYGVLKLRLGMFDSNQLNINISTENEHLKKLLQENIKLLKKQLIDVGVTPLSIRFLDENSSLSSVYSSDEILNAGFEVKV